MTAQRPPQGQPLLSRNRGSSLSRLLSPRSIAVVGGGVWCANVLRECRKIGFKGPVWPVHPTKPEIDGYKAYSSVTDLPEAPDATFIGVNREATVEVVKALRDRGAGGAVCFASGFAEARAEVSDGPDLQARLLDAAGDMPILGPNCYGYLNMLEGTVLWPDHHGGVPVESGVAVLAQSSNVAINLTMQRRAIPLAYVVTLGNEAKTDLAEVGTALLQDPRVTVLGLYLEGVGDIQRFEALAAMARSLGKSIVVLKVGASEQGQKAAVSHTASLAGSASGAAALFKRLGVGQVHNLGAFLETLKLLHVTGPLASNRIASMSCSGGEASLVADLALGSGLSFAPLMKAQKEALFQSLGPKVALANPLDYHTYIWADVDAMTATFAGMMIGDLALGMVILDFPRSDRSDATEWPLVIDAVERAQASSGKPIAIVSSYPDTMPEEMAVEMMQRGILPISGLVDALAALDVAVGLGGARRDPMPLALPTDDAPGRVIFEGDAKAALAAHGLDVPTSMRAGGGEDVAKLAEALSFPVVLKGEGVAHKTEAGAVVLGLADAGAVQAAARQMAADRVLIEEMITDGVAELLVGVMMDPAHGFLLTLGAGGTLAEIIGDRVSLLLPVTGDEVEAALQRLAYAPVLNGYRGAPAVDTAAIVAAVLAVQDYVIQNRETILEVEINPLITTPTRAVAADALLRVKDET